MLLRLKYDNHHPKDIQFVIDCLKNDGVIIVCDLLGGSPFKSAATLSVKHENISVLAGINLASCLELIFARLNETDALKLADIMLAKDANQLLKFTLPIRVERDGAEDGI